MAQSPPADAELEFLLAYVNDRRSFDFRGYKRTSLTRRIQRRMQAVGADGYHAYVDVLEANPGEFSALFDSILINVTAFLRDKDAWDALANTALRQITDDRGDRHSIRVWSAGCASGEEAYTLAVLLAEHLGETRFRDDVKIYATDADDDALVRGRQGRYRERDILAAFGEERAKRFFELEGGSGVFRPELRRSLVFGRHDLVQDPPISKIDLLVCRNTLMYFTAEAQRDILLSLHFALSPSGFLFLGRSEALAGRLDVFEPVDSRQHIFRRSGTRAAETGAVSLLGIGVAAGRDLTTGLLDHLSEHGPIAQLAVDSGCVVLAANRLGRRYFALGAEDFGKPLRDGLLVISVPDLRSVVKQVLREHVPVTVSGVTHRAIATEPVSFDLIVTPLGDEDAVVFTFVDVSRYRAIGEDLERAQDELESAYEELQSTVEELETTNEELQSTNEELETTNEELHSTNEELETINEELQSTNEELETVNDELRERGAEVADLNSFLESILASLRSAVIVLGSEMEVRAWNRQAEDLWGLRASEVQDQHFLNVDIGFPVESIGPAVRACLAGRSDGAQITQKAVNRRGKAVVCSVSITRLVANGALRGVILLIDAVPDVAAEMG